MIAELQQKLVAAIHAHKPLEEMVSLLREYKGKGISPAEMYAVLENLRAATSDDAEDDRILELADFVVGFCSPHMRV